MIIKKDLIPNYDAYAMNPLYITVHTTRNLSRGADAEMHARYLRNIDTSQKSWHFTVDDHEIIQHIPVNLNGWHAGDGQNGDGNRKSIGIEICENSDGNFEAAKQKAIELIRYLMDEHNIPLKNVVPHKHWSGKDCPHVLLPIWDQFINDIKNKGGNTLAKVEKADAFAQDAQEWVMKNGISDGTRPRDNVTRQEIWSMLKRFSERK